MSDTPSTPDSGTGVTPFLADEPQPDTWPRRADERYQPRSRLHQALDVAQRIIETPQDPWARAATPDREQLMSGATVNRFAEPSLFAPPAEAASVATMPEPEPDEDLAAPPAAAALRTDAEAAPAVDDAFGPGTEPRRSGLLPATTRVEEPLHLVVDLRPERHEAEEPGYPGAGDYGLGSRWGAGWREAAQGWVRTTTGHPVWRPVVSTTDDLPQWDIDTYLGIVTAEVAVEAKGGDFQQLGATLAKGRSVGMDGLVEEAIERGAHGVVGVAMSYTPIGGRLLITITGTAVTLRQKPS